MQSLTGANAFRPRNSSMPYQKSSVITPILQMAKLRHVVVDLPPQITLRELRETAEPCLSPSQLPLLASSQMC